MYFKTITRNTALCAALSATLISCSKNDTGIGDQSKGELKGKFFISTTTEGDGSVILNTESLDTGSITTIGQGIALTYSYTNWQFNLDHNVAFGLYYAQGDPGQGIAYTLAEDGTLVKSGSDVQIPDRFTSYGVFDKYLVTSVGGSIDSITTPGVKDTVSVFNFIDVSNGNAITRRVYKSTNFGGIKQTATFSGIVDMGNGEFVTGAVLSGPKPDTATGGSSTGYVLYPDSCWVAAFDANLNLKGIYRDGRIGYASGRYRSQYYSQIAADDNNNCYVFSGAYDSRSTKNAGAIRILKGAETFDPSYYFDIESASGGYHFRKVYHVIGDYFLLEFYNETGIPSNATAATQYALLNMVSKSFQWLSAKGFPAKEDISSIGWLTTYNGKAYIPVNTTTAKPTIYVLDAETGSSVPGLVVDATSVTAVGRLSY